MTAVSEPLPPVRLNWRLFIPLFMLLLAVLACDESYTAPPQIGLVRAVPDQPGVAYASVLHNNDVFFYLTSDYGQHWQPTEHRGDAQPDSFNLTMSSDKLYMDNHVIWSFPRPVYRFFFLEDTASAPRFLLPYGKVSNVLQGSTIYIAMGTQGVLVGQMSTDGTLSDWEIRANGIDALNPFPMTITDSWEIIGVVAFALLVPPYFLLHGFLLYCLWTYLLPRPDARRYAIFATGVLMLVAAVGTVYWLTSLQTDFPVIVAAVTLFSVILNVSLTLSLASREHDAPQKRWLALAAALISVIAPAGIASIFVGWWAVFLIVFGFAIFRRTYLQLFPAGIQIWRERWLVDRLAVETTLVGVVSAVVVVIGFAIIQSFISRVAATGLFQFGIILVMIGVVSVLTRRYMTYRLSSMEKLKHDDKGEVLPFQAVRDRIQTATLVWLVLTVIASGATFFGQMVAYGWFTGLTR